MPRFGPATTTSRPRPAHRSSALSTARTLARRTIESWFTDGAQQSAAALAYYAVFSLAPLLLICIGVAGVVLGHDAARQQILARAMDLVGPQGARGIAVLMGTPDAATRAGVITTLIGTATLLFAAVGVVAQLRSALNGVWKVAAPPMSWSSFARGYVFNVGLIIATGFLLLVSLVASAVLSAATASARHWVPGPDAMWLAVDAGIGLVMTGGLFALMFKHVPDTFVRWADAWAGAVVSAVLFTLGRMALGLFLGRAAVDSAYDAAGSVLALLAWVYYSTQLVLVGAEFAVACARLRDERAAAT